MCYTLLHGVTERLAVIDIVMNHEGLEGVCKWWRGCLESVMTTDTEMKMHVTGALLRQYINFFPQPSVHYSSTFVEL